MKDHSLIVTMLEIICSQLFTPTVSLLFLCPINLECGHGICFEQGNVDKTDNILTPRNMFGECVFLFALLVLSFDTREYISNAVVLQHVSQMKKKYRAVTYYHRTQNFTSNPQLIWYEQQQQQQQKTGLL